MSQSESIQNESECTLFVWNENSVYINQRQDGFGFIRIHSDSRLELSPIETD